MNSYDAWHIYACAWQKHFLHRKRVFRSLPPPPKGFHFGVRLGTRGVKGSESEGGDETLRSYPERKRGIFRDLYF